MSGGDIGGVRLSSGGNEGDDDEDECMMAFLAFPLVLAIVELFEFLKRKMRGF